LVKLPRSNPATYTKIFDYIRKVFADAPEAKARDYAASRFSFNIKGGGVVKLVKVMAKLKSKCNFCQMFMSPVKCATVAATAKKRYR